MGETSAVLRLQAEGETALERRFAAWVNQLVFGRTAFGLRALRGKQVPEAGRAANQFALGGHLEALGDGLFGLLHGKG